MEALAATATVIQVSLYASNIAAALQELRQVLRNGSEKLKERSKRLEVLEIVVNKIERDCRVHSQQVAEYLEIVRADILHLYGVVLHTLQTPRDTIVHRLRAGLALFRANERIEHAFARLGQDCNYLTLYLSELRSNPPMAPQQEALRFNDQGENVSPNQRELGMIPYQSTNQHGGPRSTQNSNRAHHEGTADAAASPFNASGEINQSFQDIASDGEGRNGQAASNHMGNVRVAALKGGSLQQQYNNVKACAGGQNNFGNLT